MEILAFILADLAVLLTVADWAQTIVIARNPLVWSEMNPILGRHPSPGRVHAYFTLCCLLVLAGAVGLWWYGQIVLLCFLAVALAVMEDYWVRHNWRNGIRM